MGRMGPMRQTGRGWTGGRDILDGKFHVRLIKLMPLDNKVRRSGGAIKLKFLLKGVRAVSRLAAKTDHHAFVVLTQVAMNNRELQRTALVKTNH